MRKIAIIVFMLALVAQKGNAQVTGSTTLTVNGGGGGGGGAATYTSRTDLTAAPETIPTQCSPAPCVMTSSDLNPNVTYVRVTDPNILPGITGASDMGTTNSIDYGWSVDSSSFEVANTGGSLVPFTFNSSTLATSIIHCTNGGDANCYTPGTNGFVNIGASPVDGSYSKVTPNVIYVAIGGVIKSVDFRGTISNAATATITTTVAAPGSCSGIASSNGAAPVSGSSGDQRLSQPVGSSQDNYVGVYVFDKTLGCRYLNTNTMTTGGAWGTTGAVTMFGETGSVVSTLTYSDLHGSQITPDGNWVVFTPEDGQWQYVWQVATANVYQCGVSAGSGSCSGHGIVGFGTASVGQIYLFINSSTNYINHFTPPPMLPFTQLYANATPPLPSGVGGYASDTHTSWNNNSGANAAVFIVNPWCGNTGCPAPSSAWIDEIIGMPPSGSGSVYRFAHTYSRDTSYEAEGLPQVSPDGKWCVFGSDWGGRGRADLYLVPLK